MPSRIAATRNPFPRDPVVKDSIERLPDYRNSQSAIAAHSKLDGFLEDFLVPRTRVGMTIGIRGQFGAGKTHLLLRLKMDAEARSTGPNDPRLFITTTYLKLDTCSPLELYKKFAAAMDLEKLRDIASRHLARLLVGAARPEPVPTGWQDLTTIAAAEVERHVAEEPQRVLRIMEQDLLPDTKLRESFWQDLTAPKEIRADLAHAYACIADPALGEIALQWFRGVPLSDANRRDLGLVHPAIQDAQHAKEALEFLLMVHAKGDVAVVFCLDEFERFAWRGTPAERRASIGMLKDLAEAFKQSGQCLVLAGVNEAWDALPSDVFDRIQHDDIIEVILDDQEARNLVAAYCVPTGRQLTDIFAPAALSDLCEASQNVSRRLLSLAHHAFAVAGAEAKDHRIAPEHVKLAADRVASDAGRLDSLKRLLRQGAAHVGLEVSEQASLGSEHFDVVLGPLDNPRVVVEITRSLFKVGEVEDARKIATRSAFLRSRYPRTRFCVIVVGYSTEPVERELTRVADRVIRYEEDRFADEWLDFLTLPDLPQRVAGGGGSEQTLRAVQSRLETLGREATADVSQVREAVERLSGERDRERVASQAARAVDKMADAIAVLRSLIAEEETLALRVLAPSEGETTTPQQKFKRVLQLLDTQRAELRRASLLNEGLPERTAFEHLLREVAAMVDEAERSWTLSYKLTAHYADPQPTFFMEDDRGVERTREFFRTRRRAIDDVERRHLRRSPIGIWRRVPAVGRIVGRVPTALTIWIIASIALVAVHLGYVAIRAWRADTAIQGELALARDLQGRLGLLFLATPTMGQADALAQWRTRFVATDAERRERTSHIELPQADLEAFRVDRSMVRLERLVRQNVVSRVSDLSPLPQSVADELAALQARLRAVTLFSLVAPPLRAAWLLYAAALLPWLLLLARRTAVTSLPRPASIPVEITDKARVAPKQAATPVPVQAPIEGPIDVVARTQAANKVE